MGLFDLFTKKHKEINHEEKDTFKCQKCNEVLEKKYLHKNNICAECYNASEVNKKSVVKSKGDTTKYEISYDNGIVRRLSSKYEYVCSLQNENIEEISKIVNYSLKKYENTFRIYIDPEERVFIFTSEISISRGIGFIDDVQYAVVVGDDTLKELLSCEWKYWENLSEKWTKKNDMERAWSCKYRAQEIETIMSVYGNGDAKKYLHNNDMCAECYNDSETNKIKSPKVVTAPLKILREKIIESISKRPNTIYMIANVFGNEVEKAFPGDNRYCSADVWLDLKTMKFIAHVSSYPSHYGEIQARYNLTVAEFCQKASILHFSQEWSALKTEADLIALFNKELKSAVEKAEIILKEQKLKRTEAILDEMTNIIIKDCRTLGIDERRIKNFLKNELCQNPNKNFTDYILFAYDLNAVPGYSITYWERGNCSRGFGSENREDFRFLFQLNIVNNLYSFNNSDETKARAEEFMKKTKFLFGECREYKKARELFENNWNDFELI